MDELVHQSERLAMEINQDLEMPRIKRNLSQILEAGNQLYNRTVGVSPNRDASEVRASVLLGARGYDYQKVTRNLDNIVSRGVKHFSSLGKPSTQPILRETDIQGFLRSERENAIMQVIDEIRTVNKAQVQKQYWHTIMKEWEKEKLELLNSISTTNQETNEAELASDSMSATISSKSRIIDMYDIPTVEKSFHHMIDSNAAKSNLDQLEIIYARCIMTYVERVATSNVRIDFVQDFISHILQEITETNVNDLWDCVSSIITCSDPTRVSADPIKQRQSSSFQIRFVVNSRRLLERKYKEYAETTVYGSLNKVDSDTKSWYDLMKNFLSLKSPSWLSNITVLNSSFTGGTNNDMDDGMIEGHPVWSFIWHCLRAGVVDAAIEVALRSRDAYISTEFVDILRAYNENDDRKLPSKMENQLRLNYKRSVSKSNDIYKKAVYNVLASCDLTFVEGSDRVEDYLWLRLCQARFEHPTSEFDGATPLQQSTPVKTTPHQTMCATNRLTVPQLQYLMSEELGEAHFNAQQNPMSFFKVLFLTGQFEQAIEFLFRFQRFKAHAVHIAIVLNEVGLLIKPELHLSLPILSNVESTSSSSGIIKCINYVNIITRYTKKFSNQNNTEAMYYYYLLRDCTTHTKENLFITYVSQLVRETGDFDKLLGHVNDFGRMPGVIDKFNLDVDEIVSKVAEDCENNGQYEQAVNLYDSTSKYSKVLEIMIKLLSDVLPVRRSEKAERDKLENLALKIANRYCEPEIETPPEVAGTFYLLLDLMSFFSLYDSNQYIEALEIIQKLKLLPFDLSEVDIKARNFNKYPEEIRRNISDILLATMNMLYSTYKEQPSVEIKKKAKALITFSGMIQYRMPWDSIARLIELEVLIN